MTQSQHRFILAIVFALTIPNARLAQQAVIIGPDLEPTSARLEDVSLSDEGLVRLRLRTEPVQPLNDKQYVARLTDGQTLIGTWLGAGDDGETLRLAFGYGQRSVLIPIDELLSFTRIGHHLKGDPNDDTILLATGETLVGFVDAIGETSIGFVVGDADDPIQIPWDRVHGFTIANKPQPVVAEQGMARVMLSDGTQLLLRQATLQHATQQDRARLKGTLTLNNQTHKLDLPINEVQFIEPLSDRYALRRLIETPMTVVDGGEVFGLAMPPYVTDDGALKLHAPATVRYELPQGARRIALSAAMDLDQSIPRDQRALAGCELVVYEGDTRIGGCTLAPDAPGHRLNLPLTGEGPLRIELDSGVNGPVLDRVRITDAELLISRG